MASKQPNAPDKPSVAQEVLNAFAAIAVIWLVCMTLALLTWFVLAKLMIEWIS